jgi:hypothetical protein
VESLKRLHDAGAQQLAEHAAADRVAMQVGKPRLCILRRPFQVFVGF